MADLIEKRKMAWDGMFYSVQRMDLLTISICSAGIYTIMETLKILNSQKTEPCWMIKFAGLFFLASIVINFVSQILGYHSHRNDFIMREYEIADNDSKEGNYKSEVDKYDILASKFSTATTIANTSSIVLMLIGLILIVTYFLNYL